MRWIFVVLIAGLISTHSFGQTKASNQPPSYEGQRVGSIDLTANPHIDIEPYRSLIEQKAGETYSNQRVQASIDALNRTNAFSTVELKVQPDPSGLKLMFVLEPSYYIGTLSFPGAAKRFSYSRLLQVVNLPDETVYQQSQIPETEAALIKFFHDNGYFLAKVHTEVRLNDEHQLANIIFNVQLGKHARIGKVEVRGSTPEGDRRLEHTMRSLRARFTGALLKSGKPYSPTRIKAATALLRKELGKEHRPASKITVNDPQYHPDTNKADVAINVDTGPEVDVKVTGAKLSWIPFLSGREQKKLIPIYEEASIDPDLIEEGRRNIFNYFQQKGYFDAKVNVNSQTQNGKTILTFQIDKGRKHSVADITFAGNHHLDSKDLLGQIVIAKKRPVISILSHGKYSEKLLRTSVTGIENLYKDNGFEQVKVTPEVVDREPNVYVTFNIAEGDRTTVSSLRIDGNKSIPADQLKFGKKGFELQQGKPFSPRRMSDDRNRIAARYLDQGFLDSEVKTVVSRHPDDPHEVDVTYAITENQRVRISQVLYLGQQHTKQAVIQQSANLHPEQPLSQGKLLEGESNLYDLGIFDWSSVGPRKQITTQREEEALVKVHESKRNSITYGLGMEISRRGGNVPTGSVAVPGLPTIGLHGATILPSENTFVSPRGSIEFTRRNMRGLAQTGAVSLLMSRLDQRAILTYTDPHFRRSSWEALISISGERTTENPLFEARLEGASIQFQRFLDAKKTTQLQLRYDFNHTSLSQLLVPALVLPADRDVRLSYVSSTIIQDTRDKPLDAHKGVYGTLDFRIVPSAFGSSTDFTRLLGQYAYYKPFHGLVLANSIRLGLAAPYAGSDVPTSQRFFSGGGTSLRGFPTNEAGPIRYVPFCQTATSNPASCPQIAVPVGGNQLFILNSELRYPIPIINNLGGVVFYDGGNVYRRINFPEFVDNYTNTIGVGLRYNTPIGPVRFDIGRNLNPVPGISRTQFFITLGQAF
jgi:outer membrane protein insertion porin family